MSLCDCLPGKVPSISILAEFAIGIPRGKKHCNETVNRFRTPHPAAGRWFAPSVRRPVAHPHAGILLGEEPAGGGEPRRVGETVLAHDPVDL